MEFRTFAPIGLFVALSSTLALGQTGFGRLVQYFPQFAVGGTAQTLVTLNNTSDQAIQVDTELILSDGSNLEQRQVQLAPGESRTETFEKPELATTNGWIRLTSGGRFAASLFFRLPGVGNVGVLPANLARVFKVFNSQGSGTSTGFAAANPDPSKSSQLSYRIFNTAGQLQSEGTVEVGAQKHLAQFFSEAPFSAPGEGRVELSATEPLVATALRLDTEGQTLLSGVPVILPNLPIREELNDNSPNIIGGHEANGVGLGVVGTTIGGGGVAGGLIDRNGEPVSLCLDCPNRVTDVYGTVAGGVANEAAGMGATVSGGTGNTAGGSPGGFPIAGANPDGVILVETKDYATVGGGQDNLAQGDFATISGGEENLATGLRSTVGGGARNEAEESGATVSGGQSNTAKGDVSTVSGGVNNTAEGTGASVGGGAQNVATGLYATVPGGNGNLAAGLNSFAAGHIARAGDGSFAWADSSSQDSFGPLAGNTFGARASGGVSFFTSPDESSGATLAAGGSSWGVVSDRNSKENFDSVDGSEILERLSSVPITTWNYKTQDKTIRHMGPVSQDFYDAFGLGTDDRHIQTVDSDGVALAAIQGLYQLLKKKEAQIETLRTELADIRALLSAEEAPVTGR